jgi:hypothetical protein
MAGTLLLILLSLAAWGISLYFWPFRPCLRCGGTGLSKGSTGKRFGLCKACGGSRRRQRLGSRTLHRWARAARTEIARSREERRIERVKRRTENPRP